MSGTLAEAFDRARSQGRAALIGYLPAGFPTAAGSVALITAMVEAGVDVVEVGLPYSDPLMDGPDIQAAVERALAAADILHLRERITSTLSGGERMRVLLARALAVEAPVLLADEPLAALDPLHQLATMERLKAEAARGVAVVVVLHDLGFAARYARRVVLMRGGRVVAAGLPDAVLTADLLRAVYDVAVTRGEVAGLPVFVPDLITPAP